MKKKFSREHKSAQQLIEFLLVAPFFVIIFGILTEYAYAFNIDMTLDNGLKDVTSNIYSKINPNSSKSEIVSTVQSELSSYLEENNVPLNGSSNVGVDCVVNGNNAVFVANYTYKIAFTLPKAYFRFMPESLNFSAVVMVPKAFITGNKYSSSINSSKLDSIWSSVADFSSLNSFKDSKKGVMKTVFGMSSSATNSIFFLIPMIVEDDNLDEDLLYEIVPWQGTASEKYVDATNGKVYNCSDSSSCTFINGNYLSYLKGLGATNLIFYEDFVPSTDDILSSLWAYLKPSSGGISDSTMLASASGKYLSDSGVDGILKNGLALIDEESGKNAGNYDNLNVSSYNSDVSTSNIYKVDFVDRMVIVHTNNVDLS